MSGTVTKTFPRQYTPIRPDQLYLIGIGDTYYRQSADKIVPRNFPHTTESIDQLRELASKGHLFFQVVNRGDLEDRYWEVESYNEGLVTFSKIIRLQTMYIKYNFDNQEVAFYSISPTTGKPQVSFKGVIYTTRDFDRVIKLIGYE